MTPVRAVQPFRDRRPPPNPPPPFAALRSALATLAVTSPLASAQTDWLQAFLNSSILSGTETFIAYPNGTHYVAVNGSWSEGVISTGRGSHTLGTGSYVIAGDGEPYDCAQQPAECQQLLEEAAEEAADAPPANDPPHTAYRKRLCKRPLESSPRSMPPRRRGAGAEGQRS